MDILGLIPSFGGMLYTVLAFVVALSIIVAVHEYGHYIVGRWSGIHADVFSLGFGPVLFARTDRRGTKWQIAALPFGGYVKFMGDADAASAKDGAAIRALSPAERRRTMHGAPLWARSATVAAGPAFNFLFALVIFTGFFMARGIATDTPVVGALRALPGLTDSLQANDAIQAINGVQTPDNDAFYKVIDALPVSPTVTYSVIRDGAALEVAGPFPFPPLAEAVQINSPAAEAGMQAGDVVLAIDAAPIAAFRELREKVVASEGKPLVLSVWRAGETLEVTLSPRRMDLPTEGGGFETRWLIGLSGGMVFDPAVRHPGPFEALTYAGSQTYEIVRSSLSGLVHMVSGAISTCNLSGPIGIAEASSGAAQQGVMSFVWFIAVLSVAVGLMNLFPIPVLDGGHLVFHAYEAVTRRPPSDRALQLLMGTGLVLLLSLMAFALTNDLFCP